MIPAIAHEHQTQWPQPYETAEQEFNAIEENFAKHVSQSVVHPKLSKAFDDLRARKQDFLQELRSLQHSSCGYGDFEHRAAQMQQQLKNFAADALTANLQFDKQQGKMGSFLASSMHRITQTAVSVLPDMAQPEPATCRVLGSLTGAALGGAAGLLTQEAFDEARVLRAREDAHHAQDALKRNLGRLSSAIKSNQKILDIQARTFGDLFEQHRPDTVQELKNCVNESQTYRKAAVASDRAHKIMNARLADAQNAEQGLNELKKAVKTAEHYAKHHPKKAAIAIGVVAGAAAGAIIAEQYIGDKK